MHVSTSRPEEVRIATPFRSVRLFHSTCFFGGMKVWFSLVFGLFYATVLKLLDKARHLPVSSLDFLRGQRTDGKHVSGLFAIPGFGTECLKIDWLHCVDVGLSCDYIASLFGISS